MPTLQEQINAASPGATITLPDGSEHIGNFVVNKSLTIQGKARILSPNAAPAIDIPPNTRDVIIRDVEISTVSATQLIYDIVRIGMWQTTKVEEVPVNITLDNVWVHGQATQDVQRGIAANGINVTVKNSRITDIHGRGMETQGVAAWNTPGPLNFHNNYIEAATEGIMIGGADSSLCTGQDASGKCVQGVVPTDVRITRNRVVKPLSWLRTHSTYAGIHWPVKNLLEVKAGKNIVIDGNILENCWGDAQIGFAMLITVRNQDGKNPWNVIENVTITNNTITNVAGGIQIIGKDSPNISLQSSGLRIANNVFTLASNLGGNGRLLQLQGFHNVIFENNEANPHHTFANLTGTNADGSVTTSNGFIYRNNLVAYGEYGLFTDGAKPIASYAPGAIITGNFIYNTSATSGLLGNSYFKEKPTTVPAGVGVDYEALKAAQSGTTPAPPPPPDPAPPTPPVDPTPSPDGTKGIKITDSKGDVWTLDQTRTLRNGVHMDGGTGYQYKYLTSTVYVQGTDAAKSWYRWTGTGWVFHSETEPGSAIPPTPDPPIPPPPPPPAPVTRTVMYPKQPSKRNVILDTQWKERFRLKSESDGSAVFEKVV